MEFFLNIDYQLQGMDHSGCGSAQKALNASYCVFFVSLDEVSW